MKTKCKIIYAYARDLLDFPRTYFIKDKSDDPLSLFHMVLEKDSEYLADVLKIKDLLKPFETDIETFYANDELGAYDFSSLIETAFPIDDDVSIIDYYTHLLSMQESEIQAKLYQAILKIDEDDHQLSDDDLHAKTKAFLNNQNEFITYLKEIRIEENYRWHLLMHLNKPYHAIERHQILIKNIKHIYDAYLNQKANEIEDVKKMLTKTLDAGMSSFQTLTNHMIPETYLDEALKTIYISISNPYQVTIRDRLNQPSTIWGIRMAQGFKYLHMMRDNEIERRVQIFKILSDKTRYQALCLIASGETSTKKIAEILQVSSATVSYHMSAFVTFEIIVLSSEKKRKYDVNYAFLDRFWKSFLEDLNIESLS